MAYRLDADESVEDGLKRIAAEQIQSAIEEVDDDGLDRHSTVHQVRKRCKKIRGLLRLVRPGLGCEYGPRNRAFRDAARDLSPIRDATANLETYDDLMDVFGELVDQRRFRTIRTTFEHRKQEVEGEFGIDARLDDFREFCLGQLDDVASWSLDDDGVAPIVGGLRRTYGRGHKEFGVAMKERSAESLHEWRKRVKYHWYHMRILRDVWPPVVRARRDELDELSDLLGDEHDLAVMTDLIKNEPDRYAGRRTVQALFGLIGQRRLELQEQARRLGSRLYAEDPEWFTSRFGTYLAVWKQGKAQRAGWLSTN